MKWSTGNWTSYPDDSRAFLERDERGWWVYLTDENGHLRVLTEKPLVFAPPAHPEPFETVDAAQRWVMANIPAR
jgi:hypothetical protein